MDTSSRSAICEHCSTTTKTVGKMFFECDTDIIHDDARCRKLVVAQRDELLRKQHVLASLDLEELTRLLEALHGKINSLRTLVAELERDRDHYKRLVESHGGPR